jgi:hypothetical protein
MDQLFQQYCYRVSIFSLTGSNLHCRGKMSFPSCFLKFVIPKSPYQIAMTKSDFRINNPQLWIAKASTDVFIYRVERDKQLDAASKLFLKRVTVTKECERRIHSPA